MVSGDMESSADLPAVIFQGGAVSAASFAPSPSPLAPGSLVSLFGQNVAGGGGTASALPLPTVLGGVYVVIGGMPAPLLAADSNSGQINFQVPFELNGQAEADVLVINNGVASLPENVQIAAAPALFTTSSTGVGPGAFVHQDGVSMITASNPASAGEVITLRHGAGNSAAAGDHWQRGHGSFHGERQRHRDHWRATGASPIRGCGSWLRWPLSGECRGAGWTPVR